MTPQFWRIASSSSSWETELVGRRASSPSLRLVACSRSTYLIFVNSVVWKTSIVLSKFGRFSWYSTSRITWHRINRTVTLYVSFLIPKCQILKNHQLIWQSVYMTLLPIPNHFILSNRHFNFALTWFHHGWPSHLHLGWRAQVSRALHSHRVWDGREESGAGRRTGRAHAVGHGRAGGVREAAAAQLQPIGRHPRLLLHRQVSCEIGVHCRQDTIHTVHPKVTVQ